MARGAGRLRRPRGGRSRRWTLRRRGPRGPSQMGLGEAAAHRMALLAMEQFGCALASLGAGYVMAPSAAAIGQVVHARQVPVWSPLPMALEADGPAGLLGRHRRQSGGVARRPAGNEACGVRQTDRAVDLLARGPDGARRARPVFAAPAFRARGRGLHCWTGRSCDDGGGHQGRPAGRPSPVRSGGWKEEPWRRSRPRDGAGP